LDEFVRYGMLVRRGDSKVMMPLGRFKARQVPQANLLEELERILTTLDAQLRSRKEAIPASISSARRAVDKSILDVVSHGSATSFRELLRAIGHLEKILNRGNLRAESRISKHPLRGLSPEWLLACDDGSPEVRLAGSVSSLFDKEIGQWRVHMAPVDPKRPYAWSSGNGSVVWTGGDIHKNLAAALHKRIQMASGSEGSHPLRSSISLHPCDAILLLQGRFDEIALEELLWGMTWIDWGPSDARSDAIRKVQRRWSVPLTYEPIPRGWSMLAATLYPGMSNAAGEAVELKPRSDHISLLRAGRYNDAVRTAQRRLFASGVPVRRATMQEGLEGVKVAASLAVPVMIEKVWKDIVEIDERGD
jgi:CRISPR-associated protein Csx17